MTSCAARSNAAEGLPGSIAKWRPVIAEEGPFEGLPLHYGWPANEQQILEEGHGLVYTGPIGVVRVTGPDRLSWLTTLGSQVLSDLSDGMSKEMMLLDPQGRINFVAGVVDNGEATYLLTEPQYAEALAEFLRSMQFLLRVEVADCSSEYAGFVTMLRRAGDMLATDGSSHANTPADNDRTPSAAFQMPDDVLIWDDPWPGIAEGGAAYFKGLHPGSSHSFRVFAVPPEELDAFIAASGPDGMVGMLALEASRIAAWRPRPSTEVDERALPAELDWLRTAVHTNKGCYCGQESVARILNLGKPPRRLVFLQLDGSAGDLPIPGSPVELNGRQVGVLTSAAQHNEMGPIALALLKRNVDAQAQLRIPLPGDEELVPGTNLIAPYVDAVQEVIVPVDGKSDRTPETRPGAGLKRLDPGKRDIRTKGPGTQR